MTKNLLDFLKADERSEMDSFKSLRLKSRNDATYYGGQIKKLLDRARARMNKGEKA